MNQNKARNCCKRELSDLDAEHQRFLGLSTSTKAMCTGSRLGSLYKYRNLNCRFSSPLSKMLWPHKLRWGWPFGPLRPAIHNIPINFIPHSLEILPLSINPMIQQPHMLPCAHPQQHLHFHPAGRQIGIIDAMRTKIACLMAE